ncbi:MAG: thioredoxin family protein [Planctomycetes bacterium]|nr:thioredoxin family protein [Planctomycetota bacterium]
MKRVATTLLLFALAVAGLVATTPTDHVSAGGQEWLTDYQAGLERARAENKPIFLEFRCVP